MRVFVCGVFAACAMGLLSAAAHAGWEQPGEERAVPGTRIRETRFVLERAPGAAHDRIQLHRYRGERPARAVLLYLPGTYMNGEAAITDPRHNLLLHLAGRGVETWALDYRTHFVPPTEADHSYMRDWTLDLFVADARVALDRVRAESGAAEVFVAGFSRGVTLAFGVACTAPVAGVVALDAPFKSASPSPFAFERARSELLASRSANDVAFRIGWEKRQALMGAAADAPDGPALAPGFETAGEQLARVLYEAWRPGGLADAVNGVSRASVLGRLMHGYDRYWPAVQDVEGRAIASQADDPRTPIDDCWGELEAPVLYFGAANMGADWILDGVYSATKSGSGDVELHLLEGYGHLDVLVAERARQDVFEPLTRWVLDQSPPPAE